MTDVHACCLLNQGPVYQDFDESSVKRYSAGFSGNVSETPTLKQEAEK